MGNSTKVCFKNKEEILDCLSKEKIEVKECESCKQDIPTATSIPNDITLGASDNPYIAKQASPDGRKSEIGVAPTPLDKVEVKLKSGAEPFVSSGKHINYTLHDFWRWNESDLLSNATRGVLAEFLVATAIGIDIRKCREEWAAYDLETPEGIKIEVKSAAYFANMVSEKLFRYCI
jgi:hypothetical protein